MLTDLIDTPAEADVRFQGYRLAVISDWDPSPRKSAAAEAISQRLTTIARGALVRPDIADLLRLSCQLLDDLFSGDPQVQPPLPCIELQLPSTENAKSTLPGIPPLVPYPDSISTSPPPIAAPGL
jgi:hypothetical protein